MVPLDNGNEEKCDENETPGIELQQVTLLFVPFPRLKTSLSSLNKNVNDINELLVQDYEGCYRSWDIIQGKYAGLKLQQGYRENYILKSFGIRFFA